MEKYLVLYIGPGKRYDRLEYIYDVFDEEWFQEESSEPNEAEEFEVEDKTKKLALKNLLEKGIKK